MLTQNTTPIFCFISNYYIMICAICVVVVLVVWIGEQHGAPAPPPGSGSGPAPASAAAPRSRMRTTKADHKIKHSNDEIAFFGIRSMNVLSFKSETVGFFLRIHKWVGHKVRW